jgi:hypothetical protein
LTGEDRGGGEKKLTSPLTLTLSHKGRGELEVEKKLTEPLTLTFSAKGRGEKKRVKRIPLNFLPIDGGG